jgi:UTP--glucose-1-phosphate uridylyltransferase
MLPLTDRDGLNKPVLQIIAEEALESGIEELCVVCAPGDADRYLAQFRALRENLLAAYPGADWAREEARRIEELLKRLCFAVQETPAGYGHAVLCARDFAAGQRFLLLLSDHLYLSRSAGNRCAQQVLRLAQDESCAVSAVQPTREHLLGRYGVLTGRRLADRAGVYEITRILEKPSVSEAERTLFTPGLRPGHYLCFFGLHVLTPAVFELLEAAKAGGPRSDLQLTPALNELARRERYLALEVDGRRYDLSAPLGLLRTQLALGLAGSDRARLLNALAETLADDAALSAERPAEGAAAGR